MTGAAVSVPTTTAPRRLRNFVGGEYVDTAGDAPNPVWFKPVMFGFMLIGLVWVIVFYISNATLPVPSLGSWNIVVGFGIMFVGFLMTTRWR
jgi:hypothetical protein